MSDQRAGVLATIGQVAGRLTPEFIGMLVLNAIFILGMLWLFEKQNAARERVLAPLIAACAESVPLEALKLLNHPGQ
jgi:hypothetical protein